jgi:ATP-dependent Lon protease
MTEQHSPAEMSTEKIPDLLPILPLFDAVLFPKMVLPLVVMQKESIQLVDEAMSKDRIVGLLLSERRSEKKVQSQEDLAQVGTSALILKMAKSEDNKVQMLVQGLSRFRVEAYEESLPFLKARVAHITEGEVKDKEIEALMTNIMGLFARVVELSPGLPQEVLAMAKSIKEPGTLADMIASTLNSKVEEKQKILQTTDIRKRLKEATRIVNYQLEVLELGNKIQTQVKGDMDKRQREYFLREQLKAIKEELGEKDEAGVEVEEYRAKIREKKPPRGGRQGSRARAGAPVADAPLLRRIHRCLDLSGLADRPALEREHPGQPGYPQGPQGPGRRPLRAGKGQKTDCRVSGGAQAQTGLQRSDPVLCRTARNRQDLAGALHRPGPGTQVHPDVPGRGAR